MVNPKEQVQAITTRSGVQLPEIHVKRPERKEKEIMGKEAGKGVEFEQPTDKENERKETPAVRAPSPVKAYVPPISFPQRLQRKKLDNQFAKIVEIFKKLHINIPFADAIAQMPSYAKFLKEILSNKRKLEEHETVCLNEECSASVNLMPLSIYRSLGLEEAKPTTISLQLADRSIKRPKGIIEDVLVKVDQFIFPADFIILDMEEDSNIPLILGRPFLATGRALIDVYDGKMILRVDNEQVIFNVFKVMKHPLTSDAFCQVDVLEELMDDTFDIKHHTNLYEAGLTQLEAKNYESLGDNPSPPVSSVEKAPTLELKPLPSHLRYAYLGESSTLPVIIANDMTREEENKLLEGEIIVEKNENNELIPTRLVTVWKVNFQRCMVAIFSNMVEKYNEVFMDNFSVFGDFFDDCLERLALVLQRCEEKNLVLNWEKCHFMVKEGIILGHRISAQGIEVEKAKIRVIEKLQPPNSVMGIRHFLGDAGFYRRFIQDFAKITKLLCNLLEKDIPFQFSDECLKAFNTLKENLTSAPVIVAPN
ncbi:uncharacterized protein LOC111387776 [Olea europaea var. sylvestris]|uniref:uncharacterized protein LOC111387776 n=1 Tax=Olea europaea var. sylvestris TaxID=158386 RepID=UPI000C1D3226|nr:uncharacterized protein LOC111387776 [Olea europaea var. sylvestris]